MNELQLFFVVLVPVFADSSLKREKKHRIIETRCLEGEIVLVGKKVRHESIR
jgi:hypothetical protein